MADSTQKAEPVSQAGSIAANLHEGSRSEYLAQFVFSSFGTAIPVLGARHLLHIARCWSEMDSGHGHERTTRSR
jgi:hypothetical protein